MAALPSNAAAVQEDNWRSNRERKRGVEVRKTTLYMSDRRRKKPTRQQAHTIAQQWAGSGKYGWFKGNDDDGYSFKNGQDFYVH